MLEPREMAGLVERRPSGARYSAPLKRKYGMLTPVKLAGFAGPDAVWQFRCDCGQLCTKRAAHVRYVANHPERARGKDKRGPAFLSCGCISRRGADRQLTAGHRKQWLLWTTHKHNMEPAWASSFATFLREACGEIGQGKYLIRPDRTQLLGPDNFMWSDHTECYFATIERVVALLQRDGMQEAEARQRIDSVSRARKFQLLDYLERKYEQGGSD